MTKAKEVLGVIKKLDYMAIGDFLWSDLDKIVLNYDDVKTIRKALELLDKVERGGCKILPDAKDNAYIMVNLKDITDKYILIERDV